MAFFSLITKHLLKSKDIANDLNASKRNSRKREKGKHEEYERMKQGPAENMTEAVLKEKVKELPSLQRPKKSELFDPFNAAHDTPGRPGCIKVRVLVATLPYACTAAAYDGSIPKFKQFFFVNKQLLQEISRYLAF